MNDFLGSHFAQLKQDFSSIREINIANKGFLYRQGEPCTHIFWINSGIVKLSHLTKHGTEMTIALFKKGEMLGYSPNNDQAFEETAQAIGKVGCYRIAYNDFNAILLQHSQLMRFVLEQAYMRNQKIERKLRTILTQPVEMRLAATLLELAEMFGIQCVHGYALEIHLTQQDVADLIGASRSVVSTLLNDFRNRGMLDYTRDQICINNAALVDFYRTK